MAKEMKQQPDAMSNPIGGDGKRASDGSNIEPRLAYTDLRTWVEEARKLGELREAKGLSWQEEIGQAAEVILHDEKAPAVLFTEVPGTLPGSRVLVNFFGGKRQNMTLGFPTDLVKLELTEEFRKAYMADLKRIPPRYVNDGPVFENVIDGRRDRRDHVPDAQMARRKMAGAISAPAAST